MEALLGLAITVFLLFIAFRILRFILRVLTAPSRAPDKPRSPRIEVQVSYGGRGSGRCYASGNLDQDPRDYWVPRGKEVTIAGRTIPGGMIYVGSKLGGGSRLEPALVDPRLKVGDAARCNPDDIPYWPSYGEIPPACRGRYLHWLASGRDDPEVPIGLVFIYFYGLERRLLLDPTVVEVADEEKHAIRAEVSRLLSIYGGNHSFASYAGSFLGFTAALMHDEPLYKSAPPSEGPSWELPVSVRVAVAELARDGLPVPAEWAFAWAWFDPENSVRTPAERCRAEMRQLFEIRYREKFGDGLRIKPNKTPLRLEYRPASPSLSALPPSSPGELPDVTRLKRPIGQLRELFDACTSDLDPYSRWLGRHPDGRGSLQAIALLPPELISPANMGQGARRLGSVLEQAVAAGPCAVVPSASILEHWPPGVGPKYRKADAVALAQFLEKLGYGVEPDVRFNGPRLDTVDKAVVFRLGKDAPTAPTRDYLTAELSLRLAAAVAVADGIVTEEEQRSLEKQLSASPTLRPGDRERLRAHLEWLIAERPSLAGLKRRLQDLNFSTRALLGQTLLVIAAADGVIDPAEIQTIRKLYTQLGLDPESVYSDIHSLALADIAPPAGPVTVRTEDRPQGYAVPEPGGDGGAARPGAHIVLDPKLVEAKRREAQQATALLSSIFADDEEERPAVATSDAPAAVTVAGLDAAHSALLRRLAEKERWSSEEVAELAEGLGLLAEGALETINEAAWDSADGAVLDVADGVVVDETVLKELLA